MHSNQPQMDAGTVDDAGQPSSHASHATHLHALAASASPAASVPSFALQQEHALQAPHPPPSALVHPYAHPRAAVAPSLATIMEASRSSSSLTSMSLSEGSPESSFSSAVAASSLSSLPSSAQSYTLLMRAADFDASSPSPPLAPLAAAAHSRSPQFAAGMAVGMASSPEHSLQSLDANGSALGRSRSSSSLCSNASSTFSQSLAHWHRYPPSIFILHAAALMMLAGCSAGIARGALGLGHHSALVKLLRAGAGLEFHAVVIAALTPAGTALRCADSGALLLPQVLSACEEAATQTLRFDRICMAVQCALLLFSCPLAGRLSDSAGRHAPLLLALALQLLPPLCLLLHIAAGVTPFLFLAAQCAPALCPLPLMLLVYISDVVPTVPAGGAAASVQLDRRPRGSSSASGTALSLGAAASSSSSSCSAASVSPIVGAVIPPRPKKARRKPWSVSRFVAPCFPFHALSLLYYFGLLCASWTLGCLLSMPLSSALGWPDRWNAGAALAICAGAAFWGLWLPESLVPFHRLPLPTVTAANANASAPLEASAASAGATAAGNGSGGGGGGGKIGVFRIWWRVTHELLSHFSLVRHAAPLSFLAAVTSGWMATSLLPFLQRHALSASGHAAGPAHLFPASGLDDADVLLLAGTLLLAASAALVLGTLALSRAEVAPVRCVQALLVLLVLAVLCAFGLRVHVAFAYGCAALLGASLALAPALLCWTVLQFDCSDKGKVVGFVGGLWGCGWVAGELLAGAAYDLYMEQSGSSSAATATTAAAAALVFPQRLFVAPLLFALAALAIAVRAPAALLPGERAAYMRHRPACETSQLRSFNFASLSNSLSASGSASGSSHSAGGGGNPLSRSLSVSRSGGGGSSVLPSSGGLHSRSLDDRSVLGADGGLSTLHRFPSLSLISEHSRSETLADDADPTASAPPAEERSPSPPPPPLLAMDGRLGVLNSGATIKNLQQSLLH